MGQTSAAKNVVRRCAHLSDEPVDVVCASLMVKLYLSKLVNGGWLLHIAFCWWQLSYDSTWIWEACWTSHGKKLEEDHPLCGKAHWEYSSGQSRSRRKKKFIFNAFSQQVSHESMAESPIIAPSYSSSKFCCYTIYWHSNSKSCLTSMVTLSASPVVTPSSVTLAASPARHLQ